MYTAVSMPGETGPLTSASLASAIENGGRERGCQLRHPASKCRTAAKRLGARGTRRHQSCDRLATIRNGDFVPLSNLSDQGGQVLPGFAYSRFSHAVSVLHVAHLPQTTCHATVIGRRLSRASKDECSTQKDVRPSTDA